MAKWVVGIVSVVVVVSSAYAQQPSAPPPVSPPPGFVRPPMSEGSFSPYSRLFHDANNKASILFGRVPLVYQVLGLTPEQTQKIEAICNQAKDEWATVQKSLQPPKELSADARMTAYREYSEKSKTKRDEVLAKCTGQINEVLTEKDRASLKKIEDAVQKKADADQKARDAWVKTQEDSLKAFEKEMEQVLTDEQKAKLKTSALAPRMPGPGPISIGPK